MDFEAAKRALRKRYPVGDPNCPHAEITAQLMYSGRAEARCHKCMQLIEPGPDEALIPAMVSSEDDPDTPGTNWKALGYRLVKLHHVDVQPRPKFAGGGYVAQIAYRSGGSVRTASAVGRTRADALKGLELQRLKR